MINSRGTQRNCNRNCDKDNTHHRVPELNRFHECIVSRYLARLTRKQFYPDLSWSDVSAAAARLCWTLEPDEKGFVVIIKEQSELSTFIRLK